MTEVPNRTQGDGSGPEKGPGADASHKPAGSLADLVSEAPAPSWRDSVSDLTLVKICTLAVLLVAMNYWQLPILLRIWMHDPNWTHGFIIPLFSLYLLYVRRTELLTARRRTCAAGLPIMLLGIIAQVMAIAVIQNNWAHQIAMTLVIFGLVLYLAGPQIAVLTWLPIFFLVFAMPIPERVYQQLAYPLQELAARSATFLLGISGVEIRATGGSTMEVLSLGGTWHPLAVAEACSGMRSLMAFLALGVAMAYLEARPIWQRLTLVALAVPIAIACNILRVVITCEMFILDKPELGTGFMHEFAGIVMLIPAFGLLWLAGRMLTWFQGFLMVEEDDEDQAPSGGDSPKPTEEAK